MGSKKGRDKITVEALLQLKRNERPQGDFWDTFDRDFQRRRLNALVEKSDLRNTFWSPVFKALAFGLPALLLVGLATFWSGSDVISRTSAVAAREVPVLDTNTLMAADKQVGSGSVDRMPATKTSMASSQFVLDALEHNSGPSMNFRKVLYTPAIRLSAPSGASYVKDSLSSSSYQVTSADLKLGRNF